MIEAITQFLVAADQAIARSDESHNENIKNEIDRLLEGVIAHACSSMHGGLKQRELALYIAPVLQIAEYLNDAKNKVAAVD